MRLLCLLHRHAWTFPLPTLRNGIVCLWRGCNRCAKQQYFTPDGRWKDIP